MQNEKVKSQKLWKLKSLGLLGLAVAIPRVSLMTWRTLAAFNNGTAPDQNDFDTITDNIAHIGDMKLYGRAIKNRTAGDELGLVVLGSATDSSDRSSTSTSFVNMTNMSVTCTVNGGLALVIFNASLNGLPINFRLQVDGTSHAGSGGIITAGFSSSYDTYVNLAYVVSGLSVASHTFTMQWNNGGSGTILTKSSTNYPAKLFVIGG